MAFFIFNIFYLRENTFPRGFANGATLLRAVISKHKQLILYTNRFLVFAKNDVMDPKTGLRYGNIIPVNDSSRDEYESAKELLSQELN